MFELKWSPNDPKDLVLPVWRCSEFLDSWYLAYRGMHLAALVVTVVTYVATAHSHTLIGVEKHLVFYTNWAYIATVIYSVCQLVNVSLSKSTTEAGGRLGMFRTACWILYSVCIDLDVAVTTVFWGYRFYSGMYLSRRADIFHVWNSMFMVMDLFIVAMPLRYCHLYASECVSVFYVVFLMCYELMGGLGPFGSSCIYPLINWKEHFWYSLLYSCIGLLWLFVVRLIVCLLDRLKFWLHGKFYKNEEYEEGN